MSTINKLDPNIRSARAGRAETIRTLAKVVRHLEGMKSLTAALVLDALQMIKHDPNLSGTQKHREFAAIIKRLQETT